MKRLLLIVTILLFLMPINTNAVMCTQEEYDNILQEAYNLKFTYELVINDNINTDDDETAISAYYHITISNLTKKVRIKFDNEIYFYGYGVPDSPSQEDIEAGKNLDPTQVTLMYDFNVGNRYSFEISASEESDCRSVTVYSKTISLPYYNPYNGYDECIEYPDFKLCQKEYNTDNISHKQFIEELEKYKDTLKDKEEPIDEKEESIFDKILDFVNEYKLIIIPALIIVVALIATLIILKARKNKKRVKIDLGKE